MTIAAVLYERKNGNLRSFTMAVLVNSELQLKALQLLVDEVAEQTKLNRPDVSEEDIHRAVYLALNDKGSDFVRIEPLTVDVDRINWIQRELF